MSGYNPVTLVTLKRRRHHLWLLEHSRHPRKCPHAHLQGMPPGAASCALCSHSLWTEPGRWLSFASGFSHGMCFRWAVRLHRFNLNSSLRAYPPLSAQSWLSHRPVSASLLGHWRTPRCRQSPGSTGKNSLPPFPSLAPSVPVPCIGSGRASPTLSTWLGPDTAGSLWGPTVFPKARRFLMPSLKTLTLVH